MLLLGSASGGELDLGVFAAPGIPACYRDGNHLQWWVHAQLCLLLSGSGAPPVGV